MAHYFNTYNTIKDFNAALQGASPSRLFSERCCSSNSPERMKNGKKWYGTDSFEEANNLLLQGDAENAKKMQKAAAAALGVEETSVLIGSTGVIGVDLDVSKIEAALPELIGLLAGTAEGSDR